MKRRSDPLTNPIILSSDEIRTIIDEIQADPSSPKDRERTFRRIHSEFAEHYPTLFQLSCQPNMDIDRLNILLSMMDKVHSKVVSQHDASVVVGQNLFNGFVKPVVKDEPEEN